MTSALLAAVGTARIAFVVGKGGVGKTTAAGALALELADAGTKTHLISTDPAHSIGDLFGQTIGSIATSLCSVDLTLEEFDAAAYGDAWLARALGPVTEIIESGTYLDADDVAGFSRLALPGLDEMMAVLRLTDLARAADAHLIVDTAPTGHTLRLLDAAVTHEGIARALRAMADKAVAVAGSMMGRTVRLGGERIIDDLAGYVRDYRERVLADAAFIIATRPGDVVAAGTRRLADALAERKLRVRATISIGTAPAVVRGVCLVVPRTSTANGCDGLREWRRAITACNEAQPPPMETAVTLQGAPALAWIVEHAPDLVFLAGKGGVGKSSCAAAIALALADTRDVLLCSTDPAGSLDDVLGRPGASVTPRLRVLQVNAEQEIERLRDAYHADVVAALDQLGLSSSAALDRRVIDALWSLSPPGVDEMLAILALLDAAETGETIVVDSAPTGHFLRLLTMPDVALEWTHQLMRVIVKYGIAGSSDGAANALLRIARQLRSLQERLHDGSRAGVFVVTLDEPLVRAETGRLVRTLGEHNVSVIALLENRSRSTGAQQLSGVPAVRCPERSPPPIGTDALREWISTWKIVA